MTLAMHATIMHGIRPMRDVTDVGRGSILQVHHLRFGLRLVVSTSPLALVTIRFIRIVFGGEEQNRENAVGERQKHFRERNDRLLIALCLPPRQCLSGASE